MPTSMLSRSPSLPCLPTHSPQDEEQNLSLAAFLSSSSSRASISPLEMSSPRSPPIGPSTAPPAGDTKADSFDIVLARCASMASKRAREREQQGKGAGKRGDTPGVRGAHGALMGCLYGREIEVEEVREEKSFRWRPSAEALEKVCVTETRGGAQEDKRDAGSSEMGVGVQMRGGGLPSLNLNLNVFHLKRRGSNATSGPEIIARPSDAFDHTGRARLDVVVPGRRVEELDLRSGSSSGVQDSRLLRVRQMERLGPGSRVESEVRLSSLAGSGGTASIVPEGTIASFYMGERSRAGTLGSEGDVGGGRVVEGWFEGLPELGLGGIGDGLASKASPAWSYRSESTVRGASPPVELSTREVEEERTMPIRKPSVGTQSQEIDDELLDTGLETREPFAVRRLGSPMESPIRASADSWSESIKSSSLPSYQSGSHPPSTEYVEDPQTSFFAPQSATSPGRSVVGSLRKNRRPLLSQTAAPVLPPVDEENPISSLFAPVSALSSDIALSLQQNTAASEMTGADTSGGSAWKGGDDTSIAPEDSHSEVFERRHLQRLEDVRAQTEPKQHRGRKTENHNEEGLQEVGEEYETEGEARERTEERFRNEVRRVWGHYQTRMRIINEDMERTPEEKERVRKRDLAS